MSDPQAPQPQSLPPAGWYPDPEDATRTRYWDGSSWAAPQETVPLAGAPIAAPAPEPIAAAPAANPYAPAPGGYVPAPAAPNAPPAAAGQTEGFAIAALVLGIGGFFTTGLTSIPAIIFGFLARSRIKKSGKSGAGMALAGIITGFVGLFLLILGIIAAVLVLVIFAKAGTDANGNFSLQTIASRGAASAIGLQIQSCKNTGAGLPTDQATFDSCTQAALAGDANGNGSLAAGYTIDYWLRDGGSSFCVEVSKPDGTGKTTGAWDSTRTIPVTSTCPESSSGTASTATTQN